MNRNGKVNGRSKLLLVDDDPAVLAALVAALGKHFEVVARCTSGEEALRWLTALPPERQPDLVLLDIKMPGMGGILCCEALRSRFPKLRIAMHTAKAVQERFEAARRAGADAYILKGVATENLVATLQHLEHRAGQCLCVAGNDSAPQHRENDQGGTLTPCETRVVEMLSQGLTQKEAADRLGCSLRNVQNLVASARRRMSARTPEHLIRLWTEQSEGA